MNLTCQLSAKQMVDIDYTNKTTIIRGKNHGFIMIYYIIRNVANVQIALRSVHTYLVQPR